MGSVRLSNSKPHYPKITRATPALYAIQVGKHDSSEYCRYLPTLHFRKGKLKEVKNRFLLLSFHPNII